jgi:hypothetical protein
MPSKWLVAICNSNLTCSSGKRFLLRFKEKGSKEKELPVYHKLEELPDQYLKRFARPVHCVDVMS